MISHLRGTLLEKHPNQIVIDVHGVCYEVAIPVSAYSSLPEQGAFFFKDTAPPEIYALPLHDAFPIYAGCSRLGGSGGSSRVHIRPPRDGAAQGDRKSTRLNSSHLVISYAVFCLK